MDSTGQSRVDCRASAQGEMNQSDHSEPSRPGAGEAPTLCDPFAHEFGAPDLAIEVRAHVAAPREETWRFLESERHGIAVGDKRAYEVTLGDDGFVSRVARVRRLGTRMAWEEHSYDYVRPAWFRIDRRHLGGPVAREVFSQRLRETAEGTEVSVRADSWARNRLGRAMLASVRGLMKRRLARTVRDIGRGLEQCYGGARASGDAGEKPASPLTIGPPPPRLTGRARRRLEAGCARLSSRAFAMHLQDHLARAPLMEQDRMAPLALAEAWRLPEDEVIRGCLEATREGLLSLRWDLLCPSCEGAKASAETLDAMNAEVHCASCNIRYDESFPSAVAVSFRPAPAIRALNYEPQCIGSPRHTPHVLARMRLEPGETRTVAIDLDRGHYRIRDLRALLGASLEVAGDAESRGATAELTEGGARPPVLRVAPGRCEIALCSRLSIPSWVVLEERWRARNALTADRLLAMPEVRALLPDHALGSASHIQLRTASVLVGEAFGGRDVGDGLRDLVATERPYSVRVRGRHVVAYWDDFGPAIEAAKKLDGVLAACSAAARGTLFQLDGRAFAGGEAMQEALAALRIAVPGRAAIPGPLGRDAGVAAMIERAAAGARLIPGPRLGEREDYLLAFDEEKHRGAPPAGLPSARRASGGGLEGTLVLDRYRVGGVIGRGGVGAVYAAEDEGSGASVVIKVWSSFVARMPEALQQCVSEARACSLLEHPNVVKFLDFGHTDDGRPVIVMERLLGNDLHVVLAERAPLDPELAGRLGRDVAAGLAAVHDVGVIHRDVKPTNIVVARGEPARAVLLDFGIALERAQLEAFGADASGTPLYSSPEVLRGERPTEKSDIYALGLTLYQCLTGALPFGELPRAEALERRARLDAPPLSSVMQGAVPEILADAVDRALSRDPARRIESAAELCDLLEAALAELPVPPGGLDALAAPSSGNPESARQHATVR